MRGECVEMELEPRIAGCDEELFRGEERGESVEGIDWGVQFCCRILAILVVLLSGKRGVCL
jgi:hypothetical protein